MTLGTGTKNCIDAHLKDLGLLNPDGSPCCDDVVSADPVLAVLIGDDVNGYTYGGTTYPTAQAAAEAAAVDGANEFVVNPAAPVPVTLPGPYADEAAVQAAATAAAGSLPDGSYIKHQSTCTRWVFGVVGETACLVERYTEEIIFDDAIIPATGYQDIPETDLVGTETVVINTNHTITNTCDVPMYAEFRQTAPLLALEKTNGNPNIEATIRVSGRMISPSYNNVYLYEGGDIGWNAAQPSNTDQAIVRNSGQQIESQTLLQPGQTATWRTLVNVYDRDPIGNNIAANKYFVEKIRIKRRLYPAGA